MYFKQRGFLLAILTMFLFIQPQALFSYNPDKTLTPQQQREDFNLMRQALEEAHGGFYYYSTKKEMAAIFDAAYQKLGKKATDLSFFNGITPLIAAINDGHTRARLPGETLKHLGDLPILFPFKIHFFNNKGYLFRNYSHNKEIVMGGELLSINGHSLGEILKQLLVRVSSDAHIETSKFRTLGSTTRFGMAYTAAFGRATDLSVKYKKPGEVKPVILKVKGVKPRDLTDIFRKRYPEAAKSGDPITLEYKQAIPILTIRTFGGGPYEKAGINYNQFLADAFAQFETKKIKHLIIDLRNNGGGRDDYGKILAAYFLDKPFQYYESLETRVNTLSFLKYTDLKPRHVKEMKSSLKANDHGTYDVLGHPNLGIQQPLKPRFKGKVYILINGGSFSATGESTSIIHFHKKAVFIGEECGSGYYGNTSGMGITLTLPHSKIRISIPLMRYSMAVSNYPKNHGIIPEHKVLTTVNDLLNNIDPQIEYTLKLIKEL